MITTIEFYRWNLFMTSRIFGYVGLIRARFVPLLVNSDIKNESLLGILKSFKPKYIFLPTAEVGPVSQYKLESTFGNYSLLKTD